MVSLGQVRKGRRYLCPIPVGALEQYPYTLMTHLLGLLTVIDRTTHEDNIAKLADNPHRRKRKRVLRQVAG